MTRALLLIALAATTARADLWQEAIDSTSEDAAKRAIYEHKLREGDEAVGQATIRGAARFEIKRQVHRAVHAYREASAAQPALAEPYFRIGAVLHSFYLEACEDPRFGIAGSPLRDCSSPDLFNAQIAEEVIAAWNAAEQRAPLDPRFSAGSGNSVLFERAILHTKLATKESFELAAKDYYAVLDRADGSTSKSVTYLTWGNLAETLMMLGKLDAAIDAYREALRYGSQIASFYGLAVALDRDDRGSLAKDVILAQGRNGYTLFRQQVADFDTFFVPLGEKFYYFALIEEAFGNVEDAIDYWEQYLRSGAHPQFQPRAKEHLTALRAKRRVRPTPPRDPFMDMR